jgi:hypothetical protein
MRLNKLLDQVKATGSTQAVVAVGGTDVAGWARPHLIGAASVLVVTVGSSIGIVVDTSLGDGEAGPGAAPIRPNAWLAVAGRFAWPVPAAERPAAWRTPPPTPDLCATLDAGVYRWTVDGKSLTLTVISDPSG